MRSRKTRPSVLLIKWGLPAAIFIALVAALLYAVDHSNLDAREMFASSPEQAIIKDYISKKVGSNKWKIIEWHHVRPVGEFHGMPYGLRSHAEYEVVPVTLEVERGTFGWVQHTNVYVLNGNQIIGSYDTKNWVLDGIYDDKAHYDHKLWYLQGPGTDS